MSSGRPNWMTQGVVGSTVPRTGMSAKASHQKWGRSWPLKESARKWRGWRREKDTGAQSGDSGMQLGHCGSSPRVASTPVLLGKMFARGCRWLCRFKQLLKFVYLPQSQESSHCCCSLSSPWTLVTLNFQRLLPCVLFLIFWLCSLFCTQIFFQ